MLLLGEPGERGEVINQAEQGSLLRRLAWTSSATLLPFRLCDIFMQIWAGRGLILLSADSLQHNSGGLWVSGVARRASAAIL